MGQDELSRSVAALSRMLLKGETLDSTLDRIARQFENFRNETGLPSGKPRSGSRNPAPNEDQEPELA